MRIGRGLAAAALAGLLAPCGQAATAPAKTPRRIVSLNLCADPLLLDLADPDRIVALSRFSRDPGLAQAAARARAFPLNGGSAEEVLALRPDLVLASGPRLSVVRELLKRRGVRVVDLPRQESLAGVEKAMTAVAKAVGHPERGRAEIARLEARLAAAGPPPGGGRTAAYYQRRGYLTGTGTLMDDLFRRVGLVNLAGRLHRPALSQISVEEMALARPDFLVLESATARVTDGGTEMLHHPVLDRATPPAHRIYIPQATTVCGGPAYADAVVTLARDIRAANGRAADGRAADGRADDGRAAANTRSPAAPSRPSGRGASPPPSP